MENKAGAAGQRAAQAAGRPLLAEARGSLEHDLALTEASREPAGRGLSHLGFNIGITVVISEAEDLGAREACLSALRVPEAMWALATLSPRDYGALLHVGFCSREGSDAEEGGRCITLINGQKVPGLQASRAEQAILDATAVLADELTDHFEFSLTTGQDAPGLLVYGGRAVDGCLVGVLGMRVS